MRKSKYLVLSDFYFLFNDDLTEIKYIKSLFENQNILDLSRFDKLKNIRNDEFKNGYLNFIYLPKNIETIGEYAFSENQIKISYLSNCINLKIIKDNAFKNNKIKELKLPKNIEIIKGWAFEKNKIEILDLSNYTKLKEIKLLSFLDNPLKRIKILNNIEIEYEYYYENDLWNKFAKYYNKSEKKSGNYKYEDNKWQWYPLKKK
jgi:hypothetical protein